jgi:hypothetical protein
VTAVETLLRVVESLESIQIPYMLVGALSVNQYAAPRSTKDADIVVELAPGQLTEFRRRLAPTAIIDDQLRFETATGTKRTIIRVPDSDYCVELFRLSSDAHDQERFRRRVRGVVEGLQTWVPTAEDIIVWKLRWYLSAQRDKDRHDVREVIGAQFAQLDWPYIHNWCDQHGTRALLEDIIATIPPDLLES